MADLVLRDFRGLFSKNLVEVLSNERATMFGEQEFHAKKREDNRLGSKPFAGLMLRSKKPGGRNVRT